MRVIGRRVNGLTVSLIHLSVRVLFILFEPPHDKTNNVAVRPAKTQISLGIRPI